ncbi:MAG: cytochrome c oxidase subunit II [Gammaproteobacteria bacterium]
MHALAWYLTLILIGALSLVFLLFIFSTTNNQAYEEVAKRDYAPRSKLFWLTLIAGVIITAVTLTPWPHAATANGANGANGKVVQAVASQWHWEMSDDRFHAGEAVTFQVSSKDVNHGFGIYDAEMTLLGQIQAMPGYTNSLHYTFDHPGEYKILCMEFCGLAHHSMIATITVLPAK